MSNRPRFSTTADIPGGVQEVIPVKVLLAILAAVFAIPVLLVVAIALGPVILGVICALGFGLIVFAAGNLVIGLGKAGRSLERAGARHIHHGV